MVIDYEDSDNLIIEDDEAALFAVLINKLFESLKKEDLLKKLDNHTGDMAKRAIYNSLNLLIYGTDIMGLVEQKVQLENPSFKSEDRKYALLLCMNYNLYIEKIGEIFKILLDMDKVKKYLKKNNNFISSNDIVELLVLINPDSKKVFKYSSRQLRNSLAHYSFFIDEKGLYYFDDSLFQLKNPKNTVLPYHMLVKAAITLNKFVFLLRARVEEELNNFNIDEEIVKKYREDTLKYLDENSPN